jgi:hypothetical protein
MAIDRQGTSSPVGYVANYKGLVYLSGQIIIAANSIRN